jgi:hypothetical protein
MQLDVVIEKLTTNFPNLRKKMLFTKTNQGIGIIQMEEALVLQEYGMEVMGHKDPILYGKKILYLIFVFFVF